MQLHRLQTHAILTPREAAWEDLTSFIKETQKIHTHIIVSMDANSNCNKTNGKVQKICNATTLIDPMREHYKTLLNTPTYDGGNTRIDTVLLSPSIISAVANIRIGQPHDIIESDHRAVIIDLSLKQLISPPIHHTNISTLILTTNAPTKVDKYLKYIFQQMTLAKDMMKTHITETNTTKYEIIDQYLRRAQTYAEKQCGRKKHHIHGHPNSRKNKNTINFGESYDDASNIIRNHQKRCTNSLKNTKLT